MDPLAQLCVAVEALACFVGGISFLFLPCLGGPAERAGGKTQSGALGEQNSFRPITDHQGIVRYVHCQIGSTFPYGTGVF
jgi:hypothetical protein